MDGLPDAYGWDAGEAEEYCPLEVEGHEEEKEEVKKEESSARGFEGREEEEDS
jgi:hypothetical protein